MQPPEPAPTGRPRRRIGRWELHSANVAEELLRRPVVEHPFFVLLDGDHALIAEVPERNDKLIIGRSPQADLTIANNESTKAVSRHHATIERYADLVTLRDTSTNGTSVNGEPVGDGVALVDRDIVTIAGVVELVVRCPPVSTTGTLALKTAPDWTKFTPAELRAIVAMLDLWPAEERTTSRPPANAEVAAHLGVTIATVKAHFGSAFKRFDDGANHSREWLGEVATLHERALREALAAKS